LFQLGYLLQPPTGKVDYLTRFGDQLAIRFHQIIAALKGAFGAPTGSQF
jgi:hypothetical protein